MKKTVQKGILIAMCYYFVVLINACCHCEIPQKILLSTEGIRLQNIEMIFEGDSNYYFNPIYADSIAQNKYGIQIQFDMK